jgi:hypothetical protein
MERNQILEMTDRTYRMYGLVPYNLSPIQQGIQFGHAVQEYNNWIYLHRDVETGLGNAFDRWRNLDKTFIILNGGTTNSNPERFGTLNKHLIDATEAGVTAISFREPDLGDQLTAFVFLVDDRVFDKTAWPDYSGSVYEDGTPDPTEYWHWKMKFAETEETANVIVWLRNWLKNFRLA